MIFAAPVRDDPATIPFTSDKPYAVLAGLDSLQGLQTARLLVRAGVPVIGLIDNPHIYFGHTRVCAALLQIPAGESGVIELLTRLGTCLSQKAVLIPCTDAHVWTISAQRAELADWYHIALPAHDTLDLLIDKQRFLKFARQTRLRIPETHFLDNRTDAVRVASEISYPVVLKPPFRSARWREHTKEKAFKVDTPQAFLDCFDRYKPYADTLIAQQWIYGDDTTLYSCNCYFNRDNQPLVTFTSRKLRQYPPRTGQSSLGEEIRADQVLEETIRLFQSVGYWGLGYLEMKRDDRSGEFFIVEPNIGRPTGRSAIAEAGGVDLLYTMYCDLVGLPLPANRVQQYGNVKWMHLLRDLKSAYFYWRQGELTLSEWLHSMSGRKVDAVFSLRDPVPFLSALISMFSPGGKL